MATVATTPAANEPATTEPEGSRTGSAACSVLGEVVWCEGADAGCVGATGTVVVGVVGVGAGGLAVVGAGAARSEGAVGAMADGVEASGAALAGRSKVHPGSIQWGSASVTPPGWGRPSLSW